VVSAAEPGAPVEERRAWDVLAEVVDPEIPVVSVVDLGVIRYVRSEAGRLHVGLTPTYSGCPATEVIRRSVRAALGAAGFSEVILEEVLSPAWTSDWLSEAGRQKLHAFGISPPRATSCPRCGSHATERLSEFGSTPCKAHYRCRECLEPFDQFKCI
jgi:ring-1,2-phenylacetyl-CoA epoxidase subunit PaaD